MPQTFQVLKCYKCMVFQVHPTKKSNKFDCKLCGEKQSIKRHYGVGTAKDCRLHVQRLNGIRGEIDALKTESVDEETEEITNEVFESDIKHNVQKTSKWTNYVDNNEIEEHNENAGDDFINGAKVVLEVPKKKKRPNKWNAPSCNRNESSDNLDNLTNEFQEIENSVQNNNYSRVTKFESNEDCISKVQCKTEFSAKWNQYLDVPKEPQKYDNTVPNGCSTVTNKFNSVLELLSAKVESKPAERNKSSKWNQYVEEDLDIEQESPIQNIANDIFNICDNENIDDVLDF